MVDVLIVLQEMNQELFNRIAPEVGKHAIQMVHSVDETRSFLGGTPISSGQLEWPRKEGRPLGFVGQLDLSELELNKAAPWLPQSGRILFFYDMEKFPWGDSPTNANGWAVIHETGEPTHSIPFPDDLREFFRMPQRKHLRGREFVCLPSIQRVEYGGYGVTKDEFPDYENLIEDLYDESPRHQIGGYPCPIQDDSMEDICQLVAGGIDCTDLESVCGPKVDEIRNEANDWNLLFQFDSDEDIDMMWGDAGRLFFWIRERDARASDFSKVWIQVQCS